MDSAKLELRGPYQITFSSQILIQTLDAEQRITPWQDDALVTNCPLCRSINSFIRSLQHLIIVAAEYHSTLSQIGSIIVDYVVK